MNLDKLSSLFSRVLFAAAIVLMVLAVLEKIVNVNGYTIVKNYEPGRMLELSATMMIFVIAVLLRQVREAAHGKSRG